MAMVRPVRRVALLSKFHPKEQALERAGRRQCAGMFVRALSMRLVEKNVRPAH